MKSVVTRLGMVIVAVGLSSLLLPSLGFTASGLNRIMHQWHAEAGTINDAASASTFDEGPVRRALQGYAADADRIVARISGQSGQARDFKSRFAAFRVDAQTAQSDLGRPSALRADVSRLMSDCQSCHDAYN